MQNQNFPSFTWEAAEFRHYHKTIGWYITLFAISILLIGFFIIVEKDIFAAVCIAIIALLISFFAGQKPKMVKIELTHKSVHVGNITYPYKQIKHFWVVNTPHHHTVNLTTTTAINNTVILEYEDQDPDEIRDFLLQYIPEHHETTETSAQRISHTFKF